MPGRRSRLSEYVDELQSIGTYTFGREVALAASGASPVAFKQALRRLMKAGRLASPRRGFYVIVPMEYRKIGAPPAEWYIDALMKALGRPYYVGLLSAAAIHGAAHQQPQEFQVLTPVPFRPSKAGRSAIRFFQKQDMESCATVQVNTVTGTMTVSTPETTALDLVRYAHASGQLGNVATVLAELADRIDPARLVAAATLVTEMAHVQRLGYLLDLVGASCANELRLWTEERRPAPVPLRPDLVAAGAPRDARWSVVVNDTVDVDE